jgi:hypothetical protein
VPSGQGDMPAPADRPRCPRLIRGRSPSASRSSPPSPEANIALDKRYYQAQPGMCVSVHVGYCEFTSLFIG